VAARFMLTGIGLAFGPGVVTSLPVAFGIGAPTASSTYIALAATVVLPLTYTYAVFKQNLGGLEFRFNRFIIWYAFVVGYVAFGAVATQFILAWIAPQEQVTFTDLWILAGLFALAFLTWPYFNRWMSRLALGISYNPIQIERLVAAELPAVSRSEQIAQMLANRVIPSLSIRQSALYMTFEGKVQPVCLTGFDGASPAVSIRQIEAWLAGGDRYRPPQTDLPDQPDWLRLILPLTHQGQRIGVWAFGRRDPDDFYTEGDIRLLKQISSQLALALENAQLYRELKESETALAAERASLAERVEEQTAELRAKNEALAHALSAKDAFFASMSHELRTPLNAVLGLSEALQDGVYGPVNENQVRQLAGIEASGHHLLGLINDILDAAKLQHGTLTLNMGEVAVESVCRDSLQFVQERARRKGLLLQLEIDEQAKVVRADPRRLKQILINLLNNAVKFTPEGGQAGLQVTGHPETNTVRFTVWDTGIGISQADQARLFQPFVQLDAGLDRRFEGSGLGLALVQQLAQLHGGEVIVTSDTGQGSRFTVSLPWQLPAEAVQPLPLNGAALD
jgi:signal transduction histidine kinase